MVGHAAPGAKAAIHDRDSEIDCVDDAVAVTRGPDSAIDFVDEKDDDGDEEEEDDGYCCCCPGDRCPSTTKRRRRMRSCLNEVAAFDVCAAAYLPTYHGAAVVPSHSHLLVAPGDCATDLGLMASAGLYNRVSRDCYT